MFGFETIGNATLIVYDGSPVLVTDPWISGDAYFGSWGLSHEIPAAQRDAIRRSRYCWLSHAHPDHTSIDYQWIVDHAPLVVDTRNATRNVARSRDKIVRA